jgi:hypothetical protein
MNPNNKVNGKSAEILAYGFSGNKPYHLSKMYFRPCATKIEIGRIMKITAYGLKPVMMRPNMIRIEAIEFLEAKNPFVVENSPIKARERIGKLISGERNTLSLLPCQENSIDSPLETLFTKLPI